MMRDGEASAGSDSRCVPLLKSVERTVNTDCFKKRRNTVDLTQTATVSQFRRRISSELRVMVHPGNITELCAPLMETFLSTPPPSPL